MDPTLHQKQAMNHLTKVLDYAPYVEEDGRSTVHLTSEDWHVVADALFRMDTPREIIPDDIKEYRLTNNNRTIELTTNNGTIDVEIIG